MRKMGFDEIWISWIMECIKIVSYFLVINGKSSPRFSPTREIRHGDPMLPYLFLVVVDVLSRSILRRAQAKVVVGLK